MSFVRRCLVLFALLGGVVCSAFATVPVATQYYVSNYNGVFPLVSGADSAYYSSKLALCQSVMAPFDAYFGDPHTLESYDVACVASPGYTIMGPIRTIDQCPANSDPAGSACQCKSGFKESGGSCVPNVNSCSPRAGTASVVNWTVGYQRSKDINTTEPLIGVSAPSMGQKVCLSGCEVEIDPSGTGSGLGAYVSQQSTSSGLYRVSVDYVANVSGAECTAAPSDAPVLPSTPDVQCPGYVGDIEGKKGCYGTADKPVAPQRNPLPPGMPVDAGNPAAGAKPSTGEGSGVGGAGRTPNAGTGGAAGGPAGAADGSKGTGAGTGTVAGQSQGTGRVGTQSGTEQAACGAPGQSPCKIDESGTPDGKGTFDNSKKAADDASDAKEKQITDARDRTDAPAWSFTFQFPSGCSPMSVASFKGVSFSLNPCQYQSYIHGLLSMVWAAVTAFCIIGMVGRTIRES